MRCIQKKPFPVYRSQPRTWTEYGYGWWSVSNKRKKKQGSESGGHWRVSGAEDPYSTEMQSSNHLVCLYTKTRVTVEGVSSNTGLSSSRLTAYFLHGLLFTISSRPICHSSPVYFTGPFSVSLWLSWVEGGGISRFRQNCVLRKYVSLLLIGF